MSRLAASRRHLLRQRLQGVHDEVEDAVGAFGSIADYRRYLRGMHGFRAPVEAGIAARPWPEQFGDWRPCLIAGLLAADMRAFGDLPAEDGPAPSTSFDMAGLLGQLYVLEGSTLGAQILYARAKALGMDGTSGASHLARQAAEVANWRAFVALLDRIEPFDVEAVARAAEATFRAAAASFRAAGAVA